MPNQKGNSLNPMSLQEFLTKAIILYIFLIFKHLLIQISASYQFRGAIFSCSKLIVIQCGLVLL